MAALSLRERLRQIMGRYGVQVGEQRKRRVERLAPPLEAVLLDEIAGRLDELGTKLVTLTQETAAVKDGVAGVKSRLDEQVPKGLQGQRVESVTDEIGSFSPSDPWFSADLFNDGEKTVYYCLNDPTREFIPLPKKAGRKVSMGRGLIETIYFRCDKGEASTLTIVGTF